MPWSNNYLPKYRKHRPSGQAVVTLNGRDYYLGPHGSRVSRDEYDRLMGEWLASGRNPLGAGGCDLTVVELCARYYQFAKEHYRKNGQISGAMHALRCALRYLRERYGRQPAAEFGPLALKSLRNQMIADNLSRRYINDHVERIKRMFRWAVGEQLLPPASYQALTAVEGLRRGRSTARETGPVLPVEDAVVEATLPHLPAVVADMVRLQRITGMRPAEICIIRPCDLDRSADVWLFRPIHHKTEHHGKDRVVPIGPRGQEILLCYLARDAESCCFRPCDSEAKRRAERHAVRKTPISYGNRPGTNKSKKPRRPAGKCYDTDSYRRAIHRACDKAFPHPDLGSVIRDTMSEAKIGALKQWQSDHRWSPNQLRHAAATEVRKQFGLEAAQIILGHSQANVTQVYAERDLAKGLEVAKRIG